MASNKTLYIYFTFDNFDKYKIDVSTIRTKKKDLK